MRLRDFASSTATALAVLLVTFLAFVAGAWAAWFDSFPFKTRLSQYVLGGERVSERLWDR